jgi:hypothetical protein
MLFYIPGKELIRHFLSCGCGSGKNYRLCNLIFLDFTDK